jgi:DNA-binding SARP family transcriptional activator
MIEIGLFGATTVHTRTTTTSRVELAGVKPRKILQILALELGKPVTKDVLAERLWDGRPPASYIASIESYICLLRRSLGAVSDATPLVTVYGAYVLDPQHVRVDVLELQSDLSSLCTASGERLISGVEQIMERTTGGLLADEPFAEWADACRGSFYALFESVATRAAQSAAEAGDPARALRLARSVLQHSPLSEPAYRVVMDAHRRLGGRAQALSAYADLRSLMLDELGVEPSEGTRALYLTILADSERSAPGEADRLEIHTLVRLLRQVLDAGGRPDPSTRSWFREMARIDTPQPA